MERHHYFFDYDGTLCDSEPDIRATWVTALHSLGLECPGFAGVYKTGPTLDEISLKLFPDATPERLAAIRAAFKRVYDSSSFPHTLPYPWVPGWLDALRGAGATLHVVTNKRHVPLMILMRKHGWLGAFKSFYASDMFPDHKMTKPQLLAYALRTERAAPSDSVMVGDTMGDISAARAAGVRALAVDWGYGRRDELAGADRVVSGAEIEKEPFA